MLHIVFFLVSLESSWRGELHGLGSMIFGAKVLEYWMNSSLKIKLNRSWKFRRNWNVPLFVLLERSWWAGFHGIYLVRFGFKMWEILMIFKWVLLLKIQINSKRPGFGRKKSVENMVTLECLPFNSSRRNCDVPLVLLERSCNGILVYLAK
jgi:hypothetical protein